MSFILRAAMCGALALGLLAMAPTTNANAADRSHHSARHQHHHHHKNPPRAPSARRVAHAIDIAAKQKGDPYRWGASGPNAFDCSGLTFFSFRKAGFRHIPRTSAAQAHFAQHIKRSNMKRGDLIFFYGRGGVYHVGVYAGFSRGHRWLLHAPHTGSRVHTERLWTDKWFPGTLRYRR
jgi:cell wall-associated NlpC family hydrolase